MTIHYANPDETTFRGACFQFGFGPNHDTIVRVFHRPDHNDRALALAAACLAEVAPGLFCTEQVEAEYNRLVAEHVAQGLDLEEGDESAFQEQAAVDCTYTEPGWLASDEWTIDEMAEDDALPEPTFNRFDICQAHAAYWAQWHQGQASAGYRDLCRATAIVAGVKSFDSLTENGQAIYRALVLKDGR